MFEVFIFVEFNKSKILKNNFNTLSLNEVTKYETVWRALKLVSPTINDINRWYIVVISLVTNNTIASSNQLYIKMFMFIHLLLKSSPRTKWKIVSMAILRPSRVLSLPRHPRAVILIFPFHRRRVVRCNCWKYNKQKLHIQIFQLSDDNQRHNSYFAVFSTATSATYKPIFANNL